MTAWPTLLLLCSLLLPAAARAQVQCPPLFLLDGEANTYYALVFVDRAASQEQDRLMSQVTPILSDVARKLSERSGAKRRLRLELIACEHSIGNNDFRVEEMRKFLSFKVVAVFWKARENNQDGLVQLAVPVYLRSDGAARRDVEVVTVYPAQSGQPVDSWIEVFGQDPPPFRPFVSMGLAAVYQAEKDYKAAWMALCDSRIALASLAQSTLRPPRERLDSDIAAQLVALMKDLEQAARKAGIAALPPCIAPPGAAP
jgi:hypothetical protein